MFLSSRQKGIANLHDSFLFVSVEKLTIKN